MRPIRFPIVFLLLVVALAALAQTGMQPPKKKLIEIGWDHPAPSFVAPNIRDMEQQPFDGLMMKIPEVGEIFVTTPLNEEKLRPEMEALKQIQWEKFTDNFILLTPGARKNNMDWFSDADWARVIRKVELCGEAARLGRCKGVSFDPEPYGGHNPWFYPDQAHAADKSLPEYEAQVRARGAQFMTALQKQVPNPVVFTFFGMNLFDWVAMRPAEKIRISGLTRSKYGLLPAFINGMLDVAEPGAVLVDGTEKAFTYTDPNQFYRAYHAVHSLALGMIAPENRAKYAGQISFATPIHYDRVLGMLTPPGLAGPMTKDERLRWLEHNVYYALTTADQYVWFYSNRIDWWKKENLMPEAIAAIRSAREKVENVRPLGFDIADSVKRAQDAQTPRTENIPGVE